MFIREGARTIVNFVLNKAIEQGNLHDDFYFDYEALAISLKLQDAKFCRICCQYLKDSNHIRLVERKDGSNMIALLGSAIDFLEEKID